jgi:hypothetical protein
MISILGSIRCRVEEDSYEGFVEAYKIIFDYIT